MHVNCLLRKCRRTVLRNRPTELFPTFWRHMRPTHSIGAWKIRFARYQRTVLQVLVRKRWDDLNMKEGSTSAWLRQIFKVEQICCDRIKVSCSISPGLSTSKERCRLDKMKEVQQAMHDVASEWVGSAR